MTWLRVHQNHGNLCLSCGAQERRSTTASFVGLHFEEAVLSFKTALSRGSRTNVFMSFGAIPLLVGALGIALSPPARKR